MSAGNVVFGTLIGMATGAVLGVLFAAANGTNTRKQRSQKALHYIGAIRDTGGEYVAAFEEGFIGAKETAAGLSGRVKDAVDSLVGAEPPPPHV